MTSRDTPSVIAALACLLLTACEPIPRYEPDQKVRQELFFKCLASIPKGPEHTKYNDWAEVVSECGSEARNLSLRRIQ